MASDTGAPDMSENQFCLAFNQVVMGQPRDPSHIGDRIEFTRHAIQKGSIKSPRRVAAVAT